MMKIRLLNDDYLITNIVTNFVDNYWYAPQDCLLRSIETLIWAKRYFEQPVLDIGTGDGRNSRFLFAYNQIIDMGIDINEEAVKVANKTDIYNKVIVDDAAKLSFKSNTFGTVLSHSSFEHIKNDIKAIGEVSRVLKINGLFFITVPLPEHQKYLISFGVTKSELENYNKRVDHFRYRTLDEWRKILKSNNLKIIYSEPYFSKKAQYVWYKLHKIATFKPYKRELWSYLKDSPYGKLFPAFFVKPIIKFIIFKCITNAFTGNGAWVFIVAKKVK